MPKEAPITYTGQCLCGNVSYAIKANPIVVAQCHCDECRRLSGTGHAVGAMFPLASVQIDGELSFFTYQSASGSEVTKAFCPKCGSQIYGRNSHTPDFITFTLGTVNDASDLEVEVVIFKDKQQNWDRLTDKTVCFDGQPEWKPEG